MKQAIRITAVLITALMAIGCYDKFVVLEPVVIEEDRDSVRSHTTIYPRKETKEGEKPPQLEVLSRKVQGHKFGEDDQ